MNQKNLVRTKLAASVFDDGPPPARFMWAPPGVHTIVAFHDSGKPCELTVLVDAAAAERLNDTLRAMIAANPERKPYGDFNHDRNEASLWPSGFEWEAGAAPGIYVRGEWSAAGLEAVKGKMYRSWSPTIATDALFDDAVERDGVLVIPNGKRGSKTNPANIVGCGFDIGSLTNEPAFHKISEVRAKETGGQPPQRKEPEMDPKDTTAVDQLTAENKALKESAETVRASNKDLREKILAGAIARARERNAIPPKDDAHAVIVRARKIAGADLDAAVEYLDGIPAEKQPDDKRKSNSITVGQPGMDECVKGFVRAKAAIPGLIKGGRMTDAIELSRAAGLVYGNELRAMFAKKDFLVKDLIRAATTTDANYGSLAGDLVLQETLEFLQNNLPLLDAVTTNFKAEAIEYGQTVIAHYLGVPDVLTYSATTGWGTSKAQNAASTPTATAASVTINAYKGVELRVTSQMIAGTVRNLLHEQVEPSAYALAQNVVQAIIALIVVGTYTGTTIKVQLADFSPAWFATIRKTLDDCGVPRMPGHRFALLHTDYENKLLEDSDFLAAVTMRNAFKGVGPDTWVTGELPDILGVKVIGSQEMSESANRVGFVGGKSSLCVAARLMSDWTTIFPDAPATAAVTIATHPATGLSMMLVRYTDPQLETGNQRVCLAYGVAAGQVAAGRLIVKA